MSISGRILQYEIERELGRGAMGEVYRAVDTRMFNRPVAIKILSERMVRMDIAHSRFRLEVEVAARLAHPNIVTIFDQGEYEGRPFFVMEYLEGFDLDHLIRNPQLRSFADKLQLACQICEGLDYAHTQGVVHRDLKPANIMITQRAGRDEAKLVDFGIVHVDESGLTQGDAQPGTFSYMAPEQMSSGSLDSVAPSLDLFSLGIVLVELFTGKHPFDGSTQMVMAKRILTGDCDPIGEHLPPEGADLEKILTQLLQHDAEDRPTRAAEVSLVLQSVLLPLRGAETDPTRDPALPTPDDTIDYQVSRAVSNLELGRLDDARQQLVEALKRDATNPRARQMLDRILLINEEKIPYRDYFKALRQARESFRTGNREAAQEWCRRASELWEQDFEWKEVQNDIASGTLLEQPPLPPTQTSPTPATEIIPPKDEEKTPTKPRRAPSRPRPRRAATGPRARRSTTRPRARRGTSGGGRRPVWVGAAVLLLAGIAVAWLALKPDDSPLVVSRLERNMTVPSSPSTTPVDPREVDTPVAEDPVPAPVEEVEPQAAAQPDPPPAENVAAPTPAPAIAPTTLVETAEPAVPELREERPAEITRTTEPRRGSITVVTDPSVQADIFVDRRYVGVTPLRGFALDEGAHEIRIDAPGYESFTRSQRIEHEKTASVTARLIPLPTAKPTELPATVAPPVIPEPEPEPELTVADLWAEAKRLEDREEYQSLERTLDEILAIDPDYEDAPRWKRKIEGWVESQHDDMEEVIAELLEDLKSYFDDEELDNIEELWDDNLDAESREYLNRLFEDYEGASRLEYDDAEVTVIDGRTEFVIPIELRAKPVKGLREPYEELGSFDWSGYLIEHDGDYYFAGPFP